MLLVSWLHKAHGSFLVSCHLESLLPPSLSLIRRYRMETLTEETPVSLWLERPWAPRNEEVGRGRGAHPRLFHEYHT